MARIELKDFSGGITDSIFSADPTSFEILDNVVITKNRNIESRWGSDHIQEVDTRPSTTATIPCAITEYAGYKIIFYGGEILAFKDDTWTVVTGPGAGTCLTEAGLTPVISCFEWNKHIFITDNAGSRTVKLFLDGSTLKLRTAGLPALASLPTVTPSTNDGKNYIYYYCHEYTYTVQGITFVDAGPVIEHQVINAADMSGSTNDLTIIPVLANTSTTHYDTGSIKVKIYRTIDGGTEGYYVGQVTNGTTTFSDTVTDTALLLNPILYISAGDSDNALPPIAKYLDLSNNCGWYANVANYPYRVMQSQLADPDSVPESYYIDFEEEIVGISSFQSNPIVFTENQIWRIEGVIELDGNGNQRKVMVSDGVGALANSSIVKTDSGVYFAGTTDSFYWTDGYNIKKIPGDNKNFAVRYAEFSNSPEYIKGSFDKINNRVLWTTFAESPSFQTDSLHAIYVYDITFNAFTTWSGQFDDFKVSALLCSKDRNIYRCDESGHVFYHDTNRYEDPVIAAGDPEDWERFPVIYKVKHIAFDFGASDINKWVTKVTVAGEGRTSVDVGVYSYDDSISAPKELLPLRHTSSETWGDFSVIWGESNFGWNTEVRLNQTRFFKNGKIRCKRKQLYLTNATILIEESDTDSLAVVDATAKTITIPDIDLIYLPYSSVGMFMVIDDLEYPIESLVGDVFTVSDTNSTLIDATDVSWSIYGYPRSQRFYFSSMIYTYESLDDRGGYYQKGVTINAS